MTARENIIYFGAGPSRSKTDVLQLAAANLLNYQGSGLGLTEQSHRSQPSADIIRKAEEHVRDLLAVPKEGYSVIFMQGGGTTQFSAVPYNLLGFWVSKQLAKGPDKEKAKEELRRRLQGKENPVAMDYLVTGVWSGKACKEARRLFGDQRVNVAMEARDSNGRYRTIPREETWKQTSPDDNIFTYYCDNETVDGVEFPAFPASLEGRLVACDMSSNILTRRVDVSKYAVIYAGAQKNVGITGVTIVIVRTEILRNQPSEEDLRDLSLPIPPIMMDYKTQANANSLHNTLPIFDVWFAKEVMGRLLVAGGLAVQERISGNKSAALYAAIDAAPPGMFHVLPERGCRSRMNHCFNISPKRLEEIFLAEAEAEGLIGLRGHRSIGGVRISSYNSISEQDVQRLVRFVRNFASRHAGAAQK